MNGNYDIRFEAELIRNVAALKKLVSLVTWAAAC